MGIAFGKLYVDIATKGLLNDPIGVIMNDEKSVTTKAPTTPVQQKLPLQEMSS